MSVKLFDNVSTSLQCLINLYFTVLTVPKHLLLIYLFPIPQSNFYMRAYKNCRVFRSVIVHKLSLTKLLLLLHILLSAAAGLLLASEMRPRPTPSPTMTMKLALMASTMLTLMAAPAARAAAAAEGLMLIPDAR